MQQLQIPGYILLTDSSRADPIAACSRLPAGSIVILRDYDMPEPLRLELGRSLSKLCKKLGLLFLVGKTPALAIKLKADGVHLPEFMVKKAREIRRKQPGWLITAAAHSRMATWRAAMAGADAALISPVFATKSHPGAKTLGIHRAKQMVTPYICCYALGGMRPCHLKMVRSIGYQGVAFVSGGK